MKTVSQIFIAIFLMAFINEICAQTPTSITFKVYGNGYVGRISFNQNVIFEQLPSEGFREFTFTPNELHSCFLNTGLTAGSPGTSVNSFIFITFDLSGKIIGVNPPTAARIGEDSSNIVLNTKTVRINPRRYQRYWITTFDYNPPG